MEQCRLCPAGFCLENWSLADQLVRAVMPSYSLVTGGYDSHAALGKREVSVEAKPNSKLRQPVTCLIEAMVMEATFLGCDESWRRRDRRAQGSQKQRWRVRLVPRLRARLPVYQAGRFNVGCLDPHQICQVTTLDRAQGQCLRSIEVGGFRLPLASSRAYCIGLVDGVPPCLCLDASSGAWLCST